MVMSQPQKPAHILLAEDTPAYVDRIIGLLTPLEVHCTKAVDGQEAIDYIQDGNRPLDLLITDLDMPRQRGWRVIEELRRCRGAEIPIIMQTGEASYTWVREQANELQIVLIDKAHVDVLLVRTVSELLGLSPVSSP